MTKGLSSARQQASISQNLVEEERANLEIILASLSTGVISLESDLKIKTANKAAGSILNVDFSEKKGKSLEKVANKNSVLKELFDVINSKMKDGISVWQEQIIVHTETCLLYTSDAADD